MAVSSEILEVSIQIHLRNAQGEVAQVYVDADRFLRTLPKSTKRSVVFFVDFESKDRTDAFVQEYAKKDKNVKMGYRGKQ